jgi:hypothetical protein
MAPFSLERKSLVGDIEGHGNEEFDIHGSGEFKPYISNWKISSTWWGP